MKARKNPTDEQLMRRLRRPPESDRDPRIKNDAYWALRFQGYPASYAKRVFRDQRPKFHERELSDDIGGYCDPEDILFAPGSAPIDIEVDIRPLLSEEAIRALEPRSAEYTVWDASVPGLGVRVRTSGHKSFVYYSRTPSKKLRKHTIGKIADYSLEEARQVARVYRVAARNEAEPIDN